MDGRDLVTRFFAAMQSGDMQGASALVAEDFVMEWPQSGELFRGKANAFGAMTVQADKPEPLGEPRIVGALDVWVVQMKLGYASGTYHYVAILEVRDGKFARATGYWGAPFPPQETRAKFAERAP